MQNKTRIAYIALITGALMISASPVLIRMAGAPGLASSFYRLIFGSIALTVIFATTYFIKPFKINIRSLIFPVAAGFCFAIDMAFWATGIMLSNAAMPTLTGNLSSIWVGIAAFFLFKERRPLNFWIGILIAMCGVTFLMLRDFYFPKGMLAGLTMGLFSGMFYSGYILLAQPGRKKMNTLTFLYVSTLSAAFFTFIIMLLFKIPFTGYSTKTWAIFAIMGFVIQAMAWFLINYSQGYLASSLVAPTLLLQPVLAGVIAYFALNELLDFWQIAGGLIVVAGIYTLHFGANQQKK